MPTFKQKTPTSTMGPASTPIVLSAFPAAVTAGNTILVHIVTYGANTIPQVTDSLGNVYLPDILLYNNLLISVFRATNVVAGTPTITVTEVSVVGSPRTAYWACSASEWSPLVFTGIKSLNNGTGTTATSGSVTTPAGSSVVIAQYGSDGSGASVTPSGFTQIGYVAGGLTEGGEFDYEIFTTSTTVNPTWTGVSPWRCLAAVYVDAPASGGGVPLIGEGLVF